MMPITLKWDEIEPLIKKMDINDAMRKAFIEYSNGNAVIPPVGELIMEQPPGEVHIKYGYIKGGSHYVIKIASGFPQNQKENIKPGQGMMLLFDIQTGVPEAILIDDANLTDIRTSIAGAITSEALSNQNIESFTIIGTGVQARYQAIQVSQLMKIKKVRVWGRDPAKTNQVKKDLSELDVNVEEDLENLVKESKLIITTTSSKEPLIQSDWIKPGTHITAVGSDTPEKCELDPNIVSMADLVVADSLEQNLIRGEIHQAVKRSLINTDDIVELGEIFAGLKPGRANADSITVADLTGVAVQDLVIAKAVLRATKEK
jgi:ornithine cyclodeaminase